MRSGLFVCAVFAAVWGAAGLLLSGAAPVWTAVPIAGSLALLAWSYRQPATKVSRAKDAGKLVGR